MANGEILKLNTTSESVPQRMVYANQYAAGVNTFYAFKFNIDKVTLSKFSMNKVEPIRIPNIVGDGGTFDDKNKKLIKGTLTCSKKLMKFT